MLYTYVTRMWSDEATTARGTTRSPIGLLCCLRDFVNRFFVVSITSVHRRSAVSKFSEFVF